MARKIEKSIYSFFWGIPAFLWQTLFFYIPLCFLLVTSFVKNLPHSEVTHFTLNHYAALFDSIYLIILARSFLLAVFTVCICLIIAYPVAYFLALRVQRFKSIFFALLILPFWTNFLLLVYAWYFLLENDGIVNHILLKLGIIAMPLHMINTYGAVCCGMLYCYLPFMLLPLYSTFEKFDEKLLEASRDLGATGWQTFTGVMLPLTMPGIQTGALLVFIPSFGEFVIPSLLGGDKNMYIGSVITHYFLTVRNVSLGAAFTCFSALFLVFCLFLLFMLQTLFNRGQKNA